MQLAPVIARIADKMPGLRQVTVAASLPLAIAALKTFPAACVFMPRGKAGANSLVNAVNQSVEDSFVVILAARNVQDMHGMAAAAELDALKPALIAGLLGWTFDVTYAPIEYAGYQLLHYQDGLMLWSEHFSTQHYVRAVGSQ